MVVKPCDLERFGDLEPDEVVTQLADEIDEDEVVTQLADEIDEDDLVMRYNWADSPT